MKLFLPLCFRILLFFILILLLANGLSAQDCGSLQATFASSESRCMATGSITVSATGGTGNYSYKVTGPVTTPFTSSHVVTGLQAGYYQVTVKDVNSECEFVQDSVLVEGSYSDPRFMLSKVNASCAGNDGKITVNTQQYGRAPFNYTIVAPSVSRVGTSDSSGQFNNLIPGEYFIQLQDSCGGLQVRRVTIEEYYWWYESSSITKVGCDSADAVITLKNNRNEDNSNGPSFSNYTYAVCFAPGDTVYFTSPSFRFKLGKNRSVTLIAKDGCGNIQSSVWTLPSNTKPSLGSVAISNQTCNRFTATVSGQQNLTAPGYCLYTAADVLIRCDSSGVFANLPYGSYCIKAVDACYDTTITRCFTAAPPVPSVGSTVGISNQTCSTFTASVNGQQNLTNAYYCLYNASNTLIRCDSSGVFANLPYGAYCIKVDDGCIDTTITRCFTAAPPPPSVSGTVSISKQNCTTFTAIITGQTNLTNPQYCLLDTSGNQLSCNTTGIFNNLPYGPYCIKVTDGCIDTTITRCFTGTRPVPSVSPTVSTGNFTCSTLSASITGQTNLINPVYCLYDSLGVQLACNTTGVFDSLAYASYCIKIVTACNDTLTRCFNGTRPQVSLTATGISAQTCTTFTVTATGANLISPQYCLYDSTGGLLICNTTGIFTGLSYARYCIKAVSCGDTTNTLCFSPTPPRPAINGSVQISNKACTGFSATITGLVNFTNPDYCLYTNGNTLVACNTTGLFTNIPYGSYCFKVKDGCLDTTITRCFAVARDIPAVSSTLQQTGATCSTVSFQVNGDNLTAPQYCLYNASNTLVACNTTGAFTNIPYGQYCVRVKDGCTDTTITVCQAFTAKRDITLSSSRSCAIGYSDVTVQFDSQFGPYNIKVYAPNGSVYLNKTVNNSPVTIQLPALTAGQEYKVIGVDMCGQRDTALLNPSASTLVKSLTSNAKCPTATYENGSGDLVVTCYSNLYPVMPAIIKKNGSSFNVNYSTQNGNTFTFSDLEPATYIVKYTVQTCNTEVFDTVTLVPYSYPTQGQSALYTCDNSSFSLGADVRGGLAPYTYQIIGSNPSSPSINTEPQSHPVFHINTGSSYSLVRLRTVDGCGNATLSDVSVLPLENIVITANRTCYYQNITLSVPYINNATYKWYRKTTPTDSTLISTDTSYNLPFFVPEQVGEYICKVNVNDGCIERQDNFILDGECGNVHLPGETELKGTKLPAGNRLTWQITNDREIKEYTIERKSEKESGFTALGRVSSKRSRGQSRYQFLDNTFSHGVSLYRLKIRDENNRITYTNTVRLKSEGKGVFVYPNPAKEKLTIAINHPSPATFRIEVVNMAGQVVHQTVLNKVSTTTYPLRRTPAINRGMHLVKITNTDSNTTEVFKVLFD